MTPDLLLALAAFAFVSSITPGPNNLMLMASGANFGFRRTLPHMFGVALGFVAMVVIVGVGLVGLFDAFPITYDILKLVSVIYLLFLAWKIATAAPPRDGGAVGTPMTFVQAALFQWVNPKAWAMALTAISAYTPTQTFGTVLTVAVVFGLVNLPSVGVWVTLGQQVRRWLSTSRRLRTFNIMMAVLLVLSLYPVFVAG
ncbi:MAG: LysE family translocator [Pseudomonadota bacterium]